MCAATKPYLVHSRTAIQEGGLGRISGVLTGANVGGAATGHAEFAARVADLCHEDNEMSQTRR